MSPAEAWAAVIAGEDAAVYAFGLIGARLRGADRTRARAALAEHRGLRDDARRTVQTLKADAPPAAAAYDPPFAVTDAAAAARLAALVEARLAATYASLAGALRDIARQQAAAQAVRRATAAVEWGAPAQAWPGS